jgi:hypothetical protein
MFYNKWWIYQKVYLRINERKLIKSYLEEVKNNKKPLYIHINKTAGSSIAKSLNITESHCTLNTYEMLYKKYFKEEIKEDVSLWVSIRNPFDKVASQYYYRIKTNQNKLGITTISFDDWVRKAFDEKDPAYRDWNLMFDTQNSWLKTDKNYKINYIRFESLAEDYQKVASIYDGSPLVWKKKSKNKDYKSLYSDYSKIIIEREFKEDLERFNYRF